MANFGSLSELAPTGNPEVDAIHRKRYGSASVSAYVADISTDLKKNSPDSNRQTSKRDVAARNRNWLRLLKRDRQMLTELTHPRQDRLAADKHKRLNENAQIAAWSVISRPTKSQ